MKNVKKWVLLHRRSAGWSRGQTRELVLTGIWWTICEKLGRWNTDTVAELKVNEGGIDLDLPGEMYELYTTVWKMSMKSIIAHSVARGAR